MGAQQRQSGQPVPPVPSTWRRPLIAVSLGGVLGILLLHPVTMAIYWLEFHAELATGWTEFMGDQIMAAFTLHHLPMTALLAALGGVVGGIYAVGDAGLRRSESVILRLEREMARDIPSLILLGESEFLEFRAPVAKPVAPTPTGAERGPSTYLY